MSDRFSSLTGTYDTDREILYSLSGRDLLSACSTRPFHSLCNNAFWYRKLALEGFLPENGMLKHSTPLEVYKAMHRIVDDADRAVWAIRHKEPNLFISVSREWRDENGQWYLAGYPSDIDTFRKLIIMSDDVDLYAVFSDGIATKEMEEDLLTALDQDYAIVEWLLNELDDGKIHDKTKETIIKHIFLNSDIELLRIVIRSKERQRRLYRSLRAYLEREDYHFSLYGRFLKVLVSEGVIEDVHRVTNEDSLLDIAARRESRAVVDYCLSLFEWSTEEIVQALNNAVMTNNPYTVPQLVNAMGSNKVRAEAIALALYRAVTGNHRRIVLVLLALGADATDIPRSLPNYKEVMRYIEKELEMTSDDDDYYDIDRSSVEEALRWNHSPNR